MTPYVNVTPRVTVVIYQVFLSKRRVSKKQEGAKEKEIKTKRIGMKRSDERGNLFIEWLGVLYPPPGRELMSARPLARVGEGQLVVVLLYSATRSQLLGIQGVRRQGGVER